MFCGTITIGSASMHPREVIKEALRAKAAERMPVLVL